MADNPIGNFIKTKTAIGASFENQRLRNRAMELWAQEQKRLQEEQKKKEEELYELGKRDKEADIGLAQAQKEYYESLAEKNRMDEDSDVLTSKKNEAQAKADKAQADATAAQRKAASTYPKFLLNGISVEYDPTTSDYRLAEEELDRAKRDRDIRFGTVKTGDDEYEFMSSPSERYDATERSYVRDIVSHSSRVANKISEMALINPDKLPEGLSQATNNPEALLWLSKGIVEKGLEFAAIYKTAQESILDGNVKKQERFKKNKPGEYENILADKLQELAVQNDVSLDELNSYLKDGGVFGFTIAEGLEILSYFNGEE